MEDIQDFSQIISSAFGSIRLGDMQEAQKVVTVWQQVLLGIRAVNPNEGQNLVSHSRVVDLKNGVLLVEADHPGWISLLQLHKRYILGGLRRRAKELRIDTLAFRLRGRDGGLGGGGAQAARKPAEEAERREDAEKLSVKRDLAPELAAIFEDLRQSMLTNSK